VVVVVVVVVEVIVVVAVFFGRQDVRAPLITLEHPISSILMHTLRPATQDRVQNPWPPSLCT
jgi:hypothetical protein